MLKKKKKKKFFCVWTSTEITLKFFQHVSAMLNLKIFFLLSHVYVNPFNFNFNFNQPSPCMNVM